MLSVGIFASPHAMGVAYGSGGCGIIYAGHDGCTAAGDQLLAQILFVLAIIGWVGASMTALLLPLKIVMGSLAYTPEQQMEGMDRMKHGGMSGPENITVHTPRGDLEVSLPSVLAGNSSDCAGYVV